MEVTPPKGWLFLTSRSHCLWSFTVGKQWTTTLQWVHAVINPLKKGWILLCPASHVWQRLKGTLVDCFPVIFILFSCIKSKKWHDKHLDNEDSPQKYVQQSRFSIIHCHLQVSSLVLRTLLHFFRHYDWIYYLLYFTIWHESLWELFS